MSENDKSDKKSEADKPKPDTERQAEEQRSLRSAGDKKSSEDKNSPISDASWTAEKKQQADQARMHTDTVDKLRQQQANGTLLSDYQKAQMEYSREQFAQERAKTNGYGSKELPFGYGKEMNDQQKNSFVTKDGTQEPDAHPVLLQPGDRIYRVTTMNGGKPVSDCWMTPEQYDKAHQDWAAKGDKRLDQVMRDRLAVPEQWQEKDQDGKPPKRSEDMRQLTIYEVPENTYMLAYTGKTSEKKEFAPDKPGTRPGGSEQIVLLDATALKESSHGKGEVKVAYDSSMDQTWNEVKNDKDSHH